MTSARPYTPAEFLTQPQLRARYGVTRQTVYRWGRDVTLGFPRPIKINRINYWRVSDIERWERAQAAKSRGNAGVTELTSYVVLRHGPVGA